MRLRQERAPRVFSDYAECRELPVAKRGRLCAGGCGTILSIYNQTDHCARCVPTADDGLVGLLMLALEDDQTANRPSNFKTCRRCGVSLPATAKWFRTKFSYHNGTKYSYQTGTCRKCEGVRRSAVRPPQKLSDTKRCPHCGETKPRTTDYFYTQMRWGKPGSKPKTVWRSWCIDCSKAYIGKRRGGAA